MAAREDISETASWRRQSSSAAAAIDAFPGAQGCSMADAATRQDLDIVGGQP